MIAEPRGRARCPYPRPAAYRPQSALIERGDVAELGMVGVEAHHLIARGRRRRSPAAPAWARPRRTRARPRVVQRAASPVTNCTGEATWRARISTICVTDAVARSDRTRRSTLATIGSCGGCEAQPASASRAAARWRGRRCSVWNAWLTGSGTAVWPALGELLRSRVCTAVGGAADHDLVGAS